MVCHSLITMITAADYDYVFLFFSFARDDNDYHDGVKNIFNYLLLAAVYRGYNMCEHATEAFARLK